MTDKPHTMTDLQHILDGQIDRLVEGDTTPASSNAVVHAVSARLRIYKYQMDYARALGKTPDIVALQTWDDPA